jgi:hypothetical protein
MSDPRPSRIYITEDDDIQVYVGGEDKFSTTAWELINRIGSSADKNTYYIGRPDAKKRNKDINKLFSEENKKFFTINKGKYRLHDGYAVADPEFLKDCKKEMLYDYQKEALEKNELVICYHNDCGSYDDTSIPLKIEL